MKAKLIASAALIAAVALSQAAKADSCVWVHELNDFKSANDEQTMMIADNPSHKYTVTFTGRCVGLRFAQAIAVRSVGGLFCLTPGDAVSFSSGGIRQRCMITKIEPYAKPAPTGDSAQTQPSASPTPSGY